MLDRELRQIKGIAFEIILQSIAEGKEALNSITRTDVGVCS